jgi:hypothetical protein
LQHGNQKSSGTGLREAKLLAQFWLVLSRGRWSIVVGR